MDKNINTEVNVIDSKTNKNVLSDADIGDWFYISFFGKRCLGTKVHTYSAGFEVSDAHPCYILDNNMVSWCSLSSSITFVKKVNITIE